MVEDPSTFQPLFGSDKAACGFEIDDAGILLTRAVNGVSHGVSPGV